MDKRMEVFLAEIINLFADRFGNKAILRGGMALRLLQSARLTNDLDYIFVPFKSKNDVVDDVVAALRTLDKVSVEYSLNSKCLRCLVKRDDLVAQVEIKVGMECKVKAISTSALSREHNLTARIVNVVAYDVALANKMAAWYERRLLRDLFDIHILLNMGIVPDKVTLAKRLKKPNFARNVKEKADDRGLESFYKFLRKQVEALEESDLRQQLSGILPDAELLGLDLKIKNSILNKITF